MKLSDEAVRQFRELFNRDIVCVDGRPSLSPGVVYAGALSDVARAVNARRAQLRGPPRGSLDQVVHGEASWCVVQGDALHVLRDLPEGCVHGFITDPP